MSTINALNYGDGTNTVPASAVTRGTAKSWINFNGTGTVAIRNSENVASLTDQGTGEYLVTYTSAFAAADYAAGHLCIQNGSNAAGIYIDTTDVYTTTAIGLDMSQPGTAQYDVAHLMANIVGDLA